jgi:hypothetical protein
MQVQLTESRDSVMTVHAAERTIPSKQTAAEGRHLRRSTSTASLLRLFRALPGDERARTTRLHRPQ